VLHAAHWKSGNTGRKNDAKNRHLCTIAQLCWAVSAQLRHISTIRKKTCYRAIPRNMVNFGPLMAEIGSGVWGTTVNFNGFRVFAALLHGTLVVDISKNLRRHLYSAGRPSRWALAHILVVQLISIFNCVQCLYQQCSNLFDLFQQYLPLH